MLNHLYADVIEEDSPAKAGGKKKGGSMQTTTKINIMLVQHFVPSSATTSSHLNDGT